MTMTGMVKPDLLPRSEENSGNTDADCPPQLFEERRLVINLERRCSSSDGSRMKTGVIHVIAKKIEATPALGVPVKECHFITDSREILTRDYRQNSL